MRSHKYNNSSSTLLFLHVAALWAIIGTLYLQGCRKKEEGSERIMEAQGDGLKDSKESLENSVLWKSLASDSRGYVCCAAVYLEKVGNAPLPHQYPDSHVEWKARGEDLMKWLKEQDREMCTQLVEGFSEFQETWSPVYPD